MKECEGCKVMEGEIEVSMIYSSECFSVHQDYEIDLPGFMIISAKRHVLSIGEFDDKEMTDFINTLRKIRIAMKEALGIQTVYLFQREDSSGHFHFWVFPRYKWMEEKFGVKIQSIRPIIEYINTDLNTIENKLQVNEYIEKLKNYFIKFY